MIEILNLHMPDHRQVFREHRRESVYIGPKSGNLRLERSKWMYPPKPNYCVAVYDEKLYRAWIEKEIETGRLDIGELVEAYHANGDLLYLAGWHYPQPCHGDVLMELMEIRLLEDRYE